MAKRNSHKRKRCFYCDELFPLLKITRDHFIPQAWGGLEKDNLVPSCEPCNALKADSRPTLAQIKKFVERRGKFPMGDWGKIKLFGSVEAADSILALGGASPFVARPVRLSFGSRLENQFTMARSNVARLIDIMAAEMRSDLGY